MCVHCMLLHWGCGVSAPALGVWSVCTCTGGVECPHLHLGCSVCTRNGGVDGVGCVSVECVHLHCVGMGHRVCTPALGRRDACQHLHRAGGHVCVYTRRGTG